MRSALDLPPGLIGDDTSQAAAGAWRDGSNIRFWREKPQVLGGWEALTEELLGGVCRTAFAYSGADSQLTMAFGTHATLETWVGGQKADITPLGLAAGQIDGTGGTGYGTGAYGIGGYGEPSDTEYFPRTWSLAAWGANLLASPRAGGLYEWSGVPDTLAQVVANAPGVMTAMVIVSQDQVFALGTNEEASGDFNPLCIRHSSVRLNTEWVTSPSTTSREYILPGGGRIVSGRVLGKYLLVWTDVALYLGTYVGALDQPWRFDRLAVNCGLIGPNAVVISGQTAFWFSTDRQFRSYTLGGAPIIIPCPIRTDMDDNLADAQGDKIVASTCAQFGEVRFDYPDRRDGYENSRHLLFSTLDAGAWSRGIMPRTAFVDAGPSQYPCGVTFGGNIYWQERGTSADGAPFAWFLESNDLQLSKENSSLVRCIWPDFLGQLGGIVLTIYTRFKPQDTVSTFGPYDLPAGVDKVDLRCTGRLFRVRFEGNSSPVSARFGVPTFDTELAGRR